MSPPATDSPRQAAPLADRIWYGALTVLFIAVIAAAGITAASASPTYCASCHATQSTALDSSAHAGDRCDACHTEPGVFGLIDARVSSIGMVPAAFLGRSATSADVPDAACLRCHADVLEKSVTAKGLNMEHRSPAKAGWRCTRCHAQTAHGTRVGGSGRYTMGMCLGCHASEPRNIATCDVCHASGAEVDRDDRTATPWRVAHGPSWKRTHGLGELATCTACHKQDFCTTCHKVRLPHPDDFRSSHGEVVAGRATGRADCIVCHKGTTCDDCHGMPMPHPATFLKGHAKQVQTSGKTVCSRCHEQASCDDCHSLHIHPGLTPEEQQRLRARPARVAAPSSTPATEVTR